MNFKSKDMYNHDKTFFAGNTIFELLEIEYWEENWNSLGLFDTIDLAEKFKESRIKELRENYAVSIAMVAVTESFLYTRFINAKKDLTIPELNIESCQ